jgi:hypothetical protein
MNQSAILKAAYERIYKNISEMGEENGLFQTGDGKMEAQNIGKQPVVYLGISDLCQLYPDKNGQKIEVNEMLFEAPARVGCIFFLKIISETYPPLLETAGKLIQYFKDNNTIQLEDYKWHGENEGKIFIEPVIRKPENSGRFQSHDFPVITLEFQLEIGINSLKGVSFKRVEKKVLSGKIIE